MTADRPQGGKTNLMTACEQGRILEAKISLQKKPQSISNRDKYGKTALHYASEAGSLACAQLLVAGADRVLLDTPDAEGFTPLHLSVISGHRSLARLLLRSGADPDALDKERHSAIHWAAVCGDIESLDLLLNHGANPSSPDILGAYPIHYAAQMCGAHSLNGKDPETGLGTLKKLVQRGADIQCRDRDGREPLLWAASAGSSEAVLILFTAGANISATDKDGLTALHCAASRGHTGCVETLITLCGARVDAGDHIGCSPLFYAAAQGQADCAQVLLKHCADPNKQDDKGRTPAHCAAVKGRLEILRILDSNGGDLWIRNSRGNLPLHEAVVSGRKDMVHWLLQQGPRAVNATNISGRTPLHIAAQRNNVEMCEVLIDYGAFINPLMVNVKGFLMTPLDASVHQGNQRCAKYLQLHGAVPATKVLENNEINRSLLFSLGNYAFHHKDRFDEEPSSGAMFDTQEPQPSNGRDVHTRTIRGGQQPPLPQTQLPPESDLTNVMSEDATDASVHIHLTRDDLWSLWESLMQELTSEMSGSEMSQGSELKQKMNRRSSEVKQLKPILTNVYLRRANSRTQVIAGESILDKNADVIATRSVSEDTKLRYPRRATADLKISLPKVAEVEKQKTAENRRTASSRISGMDLQYTSSYPKKEFSYASDSVGSDTEDRSALAESKAIRLRKKKSDARTWGKDMEESETSSANPREQKEDNPYYKRYLQRQARAAEMRKYLKEQNIDDDDVFSEDQNQSAQDSKRNPPDRHDKYMSHEDLTVAKHRQRTSVREKDDVYKTGEDPHDKISGKTKKSVRKHGRSPTPDITDKRDLHQTSRRHSHKCHKQKICDCHKNLDDDEMCCKGHYHADVCRLKKRHGKQSPCRTGRKKRGTSPTHDPDRKSSNKLLEVPYQQSGTTATASDERSDDVSYEEQMKLHHYHHHHHHRHHHQPHRLHYFDTKMNISVADHHLEHHKHRRRFHRRKSHSRHRSYSVGDVVIPKRYSDSECEGGDDKIYSGNDIRRSKSEMSDLPWYISRDVLTQSPVPEMGEKDSIENIDDNTKFESNENKEDNPSEKERKSEISRHENPNKQSDMSFQLEPHSHEVGPGAKQEIGENEKTKDTNKIFISKTKQPNEKSPRAKSKTRRNKLKTHREKKSYKISGQIRKSSPRRESKIPGKPPLRAAQSFSGTLSDETKEYPLKPKSQSARIEKNLPEIRVFSAEGKVTKFLGKGELSEVQENSENSNIHTESDEQKKDGLEEQPVEDSRSQNIDVMVDSLKSESVRVVEKDQTALDSNESLDKECSSEIKYKPNARARPYSKTASENMQRKGSLLYDDSSDEDGDEPDEILYQDESVQTQKLEMDKGDIEHGEDTVLKSVQTENEIDMPAANDLKDGEFQTLSDGNSKTEDAKDSKHENKIEKNENFSEHTKKKPDADANECALCLDSKELSNEKNDQVIPAEDVSHSREAKSSDTDVSDNSSSRRKLGKVSSIVEFEIVEKMVEMSERDSPESIKETAKMHVDDIIQRAQSEILKLENNILDENESSDARNCELSATLKPNTTLVLLDGSGKDNGVIICDPNDVSDPESTSEAETKFNTDSEEIQPEPDLTDMLLTSQNAESNPLDKEQSKEIKDIGITSAEINPDSNKATNEDGPINEPEKSELIRRSEAAENTREIDQIINHPNEPTSKNIDSQNLNINELNSFEKSDRSSKLDLSVGTDENKNTVEINEVNIKTFPSAEVQTDFDDVAVIEGVVQGEREEYNLLGFNRSISVQTSDLGATVLPFLENPQSFENKYTSIISNQRNISIQTEGSNVGVKEAKVQDEIKQAIMMANYNDISGKSSLVPSPSKGEINEYAKSQNNLDAVQRSPERHNPGAVFYTASSDLDSPRRVSENQNIGAMFYSTGILQNTNVSSNSNLNLPSVTDDKDFSRATNVRPKNVRTSVRDRSLESERAVAIANSAFHRLNSRGELTVFNSSLITGSNNIPLMSTTSLESKPSCYRRGEHSNLEKSGFLWVHFGSGSSPISTMKKRPSLTSQKYNREPKYIKDKPSNVRKIVAQPETSNLRDASNYRKQKESSKKAGSTSLTMKTSQGKSKKTSPKKTNVDVNNPALQVSTKVLSDKKPRKVSRSNDTIFKDESPNKTKSKIPHFSDHEIRRKSVLEKTSQHEAFKRFEMRKRLDNPSKIQQSPRIPRLCNENTFVQNPVEQTKVLNKQVSFNKEDSLDIDESDKLAYPAKSKSNSKSSARAAIRNELHQEADEYLNANMVEIRDNAEQFEFNDHPAAESKNEPYEENKIEEGLSYDSYVNSDNFLEVNDVRNKEVDLKTSEKYYISQKNDTERSPENSGRNLRRNSQSRSSNRNASGHHQERLTQQGKDNDSKRSKLNDDPQPPRPRLSETAKSSSLDEGDVRLVIERKANPDFSIKISMKDRNKKADKKNEMNSTDFSSTQCESDQSYVKDSGYISTTESLHRHRRSITIDLGHTKAMINAGLRNHVDPKRFDILKNTEASITFPDVEEKSPSLDAELQNSNQNSQQNSQKVLPSKLPVLSGYRQRSNSMIIVNYHETPRKKSASVDGQLEGKTSRNSKKDLDTGKTNLSPRDPTARQSGSNRDKYSRRASIATTGIPVHRVQSESNLQQLGKSASRAGSRHRSPSQGSPLLSPSRHMDSIVEHSSSPSRQYLDVENNQSRSPDNMRLPSILLSRPEEIGSANHQTRGRSPAISPSSAKNFFPISPTSSRETTPIAPVSMIQRNPVTPRSQFSPDISSLKLPMLQKPVRCKCKIEPHRFWEGRRTKSAVECIANLHFLTNEELAQFDERLLAIARRSSYSSGQRVSTPGGFRALRTQTLKRLKSGRRSVESVTFHVDHDKERNSFKLPTDKLKKNKKWQVVFTIGKSHGKKHRKKGSSVKKRR